MPKTDSLTDDMIKQLCMGGEISLDDAAVAIGLRAAKRGDSLLACRNRVALVAERERKPDLIDMIKAGQRGIAERKVHDAAFTALQAKDRNLAYDVARVALKAVRLSSKDAPDGHPFAYFAEETRSWWAVTPDAMVQLADMINEGGAAHRASIIEAWSEADNTALELDRALSRRLSREHGR